MSRRFFLKNQIRLFLCYLYLDFARARAGFVCCLKKGAGTPWRARARSLVYPGAGVEQGVYKLFSL